MEELARLFMYSTWSMFRDNIIQRTKVVMTQKIVFKIILLKWIISYRIWFELCVEIFVKLLSTFWTGSLHILFLC